MRKRGRPSQFDLVALRVDGSPPPLNPPECLSDEQRSLFLELIGSINTAHFVPTDLPLLVSYVQATVLARGAIKNAATDAAALATWEKAVRVQATLATRLRLAPQARLDPKTVARQQQPHWPPPWLETKENEDASP